MNCLAVGAGGFLGALCRMGVAALSVRLFGRAFPVGTLVINLTGSLVLGYFLARVARGWQVPEAAQLAVTVGFLGAYTTFSTFEFETHALFDDGSWLTATTNMFASLFVGLLAVRAGIVVAKAWLT
jgi:CrcB protein